MGKDKDLNSHKDVRDEIASIAIRMIREEGPMSTGTLVSSMHESGVATLMLYGHEVPMQRYTVQASLRDSDEVMQDPDGYWHVKPEVR